MADLDLRPLSLGEILDRTFSLYRRNFLLFLGITALPQLFILAFNLVRTIPAASHTAATNRVVVLNPNQVPISSSAGIMALGAVGLLIGVVIYVGVYLLAQGATVYAVSELYLGRRTTIGASLRRMRGHILNLLGVTLLNGLAILGATILLIIPGVWLACRLVTCVPAALLEDLGAGESLSRSYHLTEDNAGRSFVIYLLYFVLFFTASVVFVTPFQFAAGLAGARNPGSMSMWLALAQLGNFAATILVTPILTIATAVFYYDLRVRKEAFDLQLMMNPSGVIPAAGSGPAGVPTMFS
jgi:hypothetical protein